MLLNKKKKWNDKRTCDWRGVQLPNSLVKVGLTEKVSIFSSKDLKRQNNCYRSVCRKMTQP
jgi:hypothetical protein